MASGRFAAAGALYAAALAHSDLPAVRARWALCLWEEGKTGEALEEGSKACAALPAGHPARLFHAMALLEEGRFADAQVQLSAVREKDPQNPFAAGLKALALLRQGKMREAAAELKPGVFGSPVFRAHLLTAIELHLLESTPRKKWAEEYVECVL